MHLVFPHPFDGLLEQSREHFETLQVKQHAGIKIQINVAHKVWHEEFLLIQLRAVWWMYAL